ncbi:MAG: hypothetical protein ACE14L_16725 [Terriglobales bacterium]
MLDSIAGSPCLRIRFITILLLLAFPLAGQELSETIPQRLRLSLKEHMRDLAETPLDVQTTITYLDGPGRIRKVKRNKHRFEVTRVRWGDDPAFAFSARRLHRGTAGEQMFADYGVFYPPFFLGAADDQYVFPTISESGDTSVVGYRSKDLSCRAFEPLRNPVFKFKLTVWCGEGKFTLATPGLLLTGSEFRAWDLPVANGERELRGYSMQAELQQLELPGTNRPLVLPRKVIAILETERGRTVVESEYVPLVQSRN